MSINDKIFKLMELQNISQHELARKTGIAQSTISDWKNRGTIPPGDKIPLICEVLNINLCDLYDEKIENVEQKYVIDTEDDLYEFVSKYKGMNKTMQKRLLAYMKAFLAIENNER